MRCDEGIAWVAFVVHNFNDFDYITFFLGFVLSLSWPCVGALR